LYWIRSDGSGEAQRLTDGKLFEVPHSFSPDGRRLAFSQLGNGGSFDIFTAPVEGGPGVRLGKAELFLGTPFNELYPAFSPDGRWLAYESNETGTNEVYVRPYPGPGGRWQISTGGGGFALWSRDGRELLFETLDWRVMAVSYTAKSDSFAAIIADDANGDKPITHLTSLLNFFDELRRRAPASKQGKSRDNRSLEIGWLDYSRKVRNSEVTFFATLHVDKIRESVEALTSWMPIRGIIWLPNVA